MGVSRNDLTEARIAYKLLLPDEQPPLAEEVPLHLG